MRDPNCGSGIFTRASDRCFSGDFLGFGGMEDVRFRLPRAAPCRLILMAQLKSYRPARRAEFSFQGFVRDRMVFTGIMIGVPIHVSDHVQHAGNE